MLDSSYGLSCLFPGTSGSWPRKTPPVCSLLTIADASSQRFGLGGLRTSTPGTTRRQQVTADYAN